MTKRTVYDKKRLDKVSGDQLLVITRAQALACGMPSSTMDDKIRGGDQWQVLLPGIYLIVTGVATQEQREVAALLYAGEKGVITGPCAVRRRRLDCPGPNNVDVLVPMNVRRNGTGFVRLHRTKRIPDRKTWTSSGLLRFVPAARAVADAARVMLRDGPTQRCSLLRIVLEELATGIRSHAENNLRRLISQAKVPQPMYNAKLYTLDGVFIAMVDAWWGKVGVAAEADSRAYHIDHRAQDKDRNRHDRMIAHGIFPLHFSPYRIDNEGSSVLGEITDSLGYGGERPRLPIIALPPDAEWDEKWAARARELAATFGPKQPAEVPAGSMVLSPGLSGVDTGQVEFG
ncbi:MAG: hypothetical protein ACRDN0_26325, partial [Trebonia sp.]